jgi:hypothetical protein
MYEFLNLLYDTSEFIEQRALVKDVIELIACLTKELCFLEIHSAVGNCRKASIR